MAASLALLASAAAGLAAGSVPEAGAALLARGWQSADHVACEGLRPGAYYEVANEAASAELLVLGEDRLLVSHLPLPEAPYDCREVPAPQFVEEIR